MLAWCAVGLLSAALAAVTVRPVNLSGTWHLNTHRSDWGALPKPVSVVLQIDQTDSALTYSGVVIYSGEEARPFSFTGAIDGREYQMTRSFGTGRVGLRRIDASTIESVFRTEDGSSVETCRITLAEHGRTLIRRIHTRSPAGVFNLVEVYDRR